MAEMQSVGHQYLGQLQTKAIEYINNYRIQPGYDQVQYFYRCKDEQYFKAVAMKNNIMVPMWKDFNGDPRSPINGRLTGVFLGVWLFNGGLPTASPFGNTRVSFPIEAIFTEGTNLYFTDFYCFSPESYHYVTLVLTIEGSAADEFCKSSLLKLDQVNNPFLWKSENGFNVVNAGVIGKGSSTPGGLPKNPNCLQCNPTSSTQVTIPL